MAEWRDRAAREQAEAEARMAADQKERDDRAAAEAADLAALEAEHGSALKE